MDVGSFSTRAGFARDPSPRCVFRTVVGEVRHRGISIAVGDRNYLIGNQAIEKRGFLNMRSPVQSGRVTNWDDAERLWHFTFYEALKVR